MRDETWAENADCTDSLSFQNKMAERVGFEPTCRFRDKSLSRRSRYDHFGTSPLIDRRGPLHPAWLTSLACAPFRSLYLSEGFALRLPTRSLPRFAFLQRL